MQVMLYRSGMPFVRLDLLRKCEEEGTGLGQQLDAVDRPDRDDQTQCAMRHDVIEAKR